MIPVSKPSITALEKQYLNEAIDSTFISQGSFVVRFERSWAAYNGYKYGVSCNSGTTAMYLALLAIGIGKGDEVLVPEFTMAATAWAVTYTGATPIFIDCGDDLNMNLELIKAAVTPNTKAIMPVHIYGRAVKSEVYEIAQEHGLWVVEDMAEAHGIPPRGDIACYSFQGNKIITTGEGGMCLTNDERLADEMRKLSSLYFNKERTMIHDKIGHNFRMTNLQAAIGLAQVQRIGELLEKRKEVERLYNKYLPAKYKMPERDVVWMYDIQCEDNEALKKKLFEAGIDSRYGFKPMSMQPMYSRSYENSKAYEWSKKILYLPTFPDLSEEEIKYICSNL